MSDVHWEDVAILADWGESSGGGAWIKLLMPIRDMPTWRKLKGSTYVVTACVVVEANGKYDLDKNQVWRNDGMQLGFGETDTKGGWVKFRIQPEDLAFFRGMKDEYFYWKFILSEKVEKIAKAKAKAKKEKGEFGHEVRDLHVAGFFRSPAVWRAIGTDEQYQAWTRKQKCAITNGFDWDGEKGEERVDYAHVRRSGESGTGIKPEYSGVPLTHAMHQLQHNGGETAAYDKYLVRRGIDSGGVVTETAAKDWFNKKAMENIESWSHEMLANQLKVASLTQVKPDDMLLWAQKNNLTQYLPKSYKDI